MMDAKEHKNGFPREGPVPSNLPRQTIGRCERERTFALLLLAAQTRCCTPHHVSSANHRFMDYYPTSRSRKVQALCSGEVFEHVYDQADGGVTYGRQYCHDHWSMVPQSLAHVCRGDHGSLRLVTRRVVPENIQGMSRGLYHEFRRLQ